jgi:hypothetical protein
VLTGSIGDASVGFAHEPIRMIAQQSRVVGAMIDDQINHQLQAAGVRFGDHGATLLVGRGGIAGIQQRRVQLKIIRDGVEAAGTSGALDGIDVNPVEAHLASAHPDEVASG